MKLPNFSALTSPVSESNGMATTGAALFFDSIQKWIRYAAEAFVGGAPDLNTAGAIPKVAAIPGTLEESAAKDDGSLWYILGRKFIVGASTLWSGAVASVHAAADANLEISDGSFASGLGSGVALHSLNDAADANGPIDIRAAIPGSSTKRASAHRRRRRITSAT